MPLAVPPSPDPVRPASVIRDTSGFLRDVSEISVGHAHVCAVTRSHEVLCWGYNAVGQLGIRLDGSSVGEQSTVPHQVGGLPPIRTVAAGAQHTCAIDLRGQVYCWGSEGADVVVTPGSVSGSMKLRHPKLGKPVQVPLGPAEARVMAVSGSEACVAFDNEVACWKTFQAIPLGADSIRPLRVMRTAIPGVGSLAMGHGNVCAVASGDLVCWNFGRTATHVALRQSDRFKISRIAMGEQYACVLSESGDARCWKSLIGDFWSKPPTLEIRWPKKVKTRTLAIGDSPICTTDATGRVDCFLSEETGLTDQAVADSWASRKLEPHPIQGVDGAIAVGLGSGVNVFGYGYGCALRETPDTVGAQVLCWGENSTGQLGDGTTDTVKSAVRVRARSD